MYDYGFGDLSNALYEALIQYPPNFADAQKLVDMGADIHAKSKSDDDENILAQIILGYPHVDYPDEELSNEEFKAYWSNFDGRYLPQIIQFFLDNGFDVARDHQRYGADCLRNLTWSSYDGFILDATKLLLSVGASYDFTDEDHESVMAWVGTKAAVSSNVSHNDKESQLFSAMLEILDAHQHGQNYNVIDSWTRCEGLHINQIIVEKSYTVTSLGKDIYPSGTILVEGNVYLICEGKPLRINNYAEIAVDPRELDNADLIDVSNQHPDLIGAQICRIDFPDFNSYSECLRSPNFVIELNNGTSIQCEALRIDGNVKLAIYANHKN